MSRSSPADGHRHRLPLSRTTEPVTAGARLHSATHPPRAARQADTTGSQDRRPARSVYHEQHDPENSGKPGTQPAHPHAVQKPTPRHSRCHCCVFWRVPRRPQAMTAGAASSGADRPEPAGLPGRPRRSRPHSQAVRDPGAVDHRECQNALLDTACAVIPAYEVRVVHNARSASSLSVHTVRCAAAKSTTTPSRRAPDGWLAT